MRILFLDDDKTRVFTFRQMMGSGHDIVVVETPDEAIAALARRSRFDLASLDHDLFGKVYQPSDEKSGFAVCQFLHKLDHRALPQKIICHSYNEDGVKKMMAEIAVLPCEQYAAFFDSPDYWGLLITEMEAV